MLSSSTVGLRCDGRETVSLPNNVLSLSYSYSPSDVARTAFLGVPGLLHEYSFTLHAANNPGTASVFTKIVTPNGITIPLTQTAQSLYQASYSEVPIKVFLLGGKSLTARAQIGDYEFIFRRNSIRDAVFKLEMITDTLGIVFRLFWIPDQPRWLEMRERSTGDSVTYQVERSTDAISLVEWQRRSQSGSTTKPNTEALRLDLTGGVVSQMKAGAYTTTVRYGLLESDVPVITGVFRGTKPGEIAYAQQYRYSATGSLLAKSFSLVGLGKPFESFYRYEEPSITQADNPVFKDKETYSYAQVGSQVVAVNQATSERTLSFTYDQNRPGEITKVDDNRFSNPVFNLLSLSNTSISWRDLTATYTRTETKPKPEESLVALSVEPSNPLQKPYRVESSTSPEGSSTVVTMGSLVVREQQSFSEGQTRTRSTVTVAGVTLSDTEETASSKNSNDAIETLSEVTDKLAGIRVKETSSFSPKGLTRDILATLASGIQYSRSLKSESSEGESFSFEERQRFLNKLVSSLSFSSSRDAATMKHKDSVAGAFNYGVADKSAQFNSNGELVRSTAAHSWEAP